MARSFLLRFASMTDADNLMATGGYGSLEPRDAAQVTIDIPVPGTLNGQVVTPTEQFTFTSDQLKALTLPHTINRSLPYDWAGVIGSIQVPFTVTERQTFVRRRENWIDFVVNGERYSVRDDGGFELIPSEGVEIWDFDSNSGWPLVNKRAVYDEEGTLVSAPSRIPGTFVVLRFVGAARIESDTRENPLDETIWETSVLANSFKTLGTPKTYTRTAAQTDWGEGYTLTYYERTIGGTVVGMVDIASLPEQLIEQHGIIRTVV